MLRTKSSELFEEAKRRMPGGVSSPVRAFGAVGGDPLFIRRAKGSKIADCDGNRFIDYVLSWGALIAGHAPKSVVEAVCETAMRGMSFGAPTALEVALARSIQGAFPLMEQVRFVNSGTEATMSAIRLARAATKRQKIVKFEGCYHGHSDALLVKAGSGAMTFGVPDSEGVPKDLARDTLTLPFNDIKAVEALMQRQGNEIACLIVEPVPGNMGTVLPEAGFLAALREWTRPFGTLLIFDEVISGFRTAFGGAQSRFGIRPDLTCLGKIIGGGLPVGAYGGKLELMQQVAPVGPVYQAGTLSGNPLGMAAGIAMLSLLARPKFYERLEARAAQLEAGLTHAARRARVPVQINRIASQMTLFFSECPVRDYRSALLSDRQKFSKFFRALLEKGVYFPPSQFEAFFLSSAHTESDVEKTIAAAAFAFGQVR